MARNTVTQKFRDTATDEQWKQLVTDHDTLSKEEFEDKYDFSWSSIMQDAVDKGYYEKKRNYSSSAPGETRTTGKLQFYVADTPADTKKIARSVQLNKDIYDRLQKLESDKGQYTHSSILNQLLDDALKKYGY